MLQEFTTPLAFLLMKSEEIREKKGEEHLEEISELIFHRARHLQPWGHIQPSPEDRARHSKAKLPLPQILLHLELLPLSRWDQDRQQEDFRRPLDYLTRRKTLPSLHSTCLRNLISSSFFSSSLMILEVVTLTSTPSTTNLRVRFRVFLFIWESWGGQGGGDRRVKQLPRAVLEPSEQF